MFQITVADFAKEHEAPVYQVVHILMKIKKYTARTDTISANQAAFVRAELRKKDRAKRKQAPKSLLEVADRLVIPAISIKMPKIYERYLAAFQEKALMQRRINNNAILRDLGYYPKTPRFLRTFRPRISPRLPLALKKMLPS